MIYLYENLAEYSDESYLKHLNALPAWRKEKALQYRKLDDRKRCVFAFVLLQHALREKYGITEVPEFVYNEFGKPSLPNLPIHFSLSHCKDAVACAVSDHNIGTTYAFTLANPNWQYEGQNIVTLNHTEKHDISWTNNGDGTFSFTITAEQFMEHVVLTEFELDTKVKYDAYNAVLGTGSIVITVSDGVTASN